MSSAPDLAPFDETIVVSDVISGVDGTATISQTSSITADRIHASGSHDVQLDGATGAAINYVVRSNVFESSSSFSTTFSVSEDTPYTLEADLTRSLEWALEPEGFLPHVNADVVVELVGPGGVVASVMAPESSTCSPDLCGDANLDVAGVLSPGTYTLTAYATGEGYSDCLDVGGGVSCFNAEGTASTMSPSPRARSRCPRAAPSERWLSPPCWPSQDTGAWDASARGMLDQVVHVAGKRIRVV